MNMRVQARRAGFTLIELLAVIAIIALLMAVLIPALLNARAQARLVVCQSNLHNIAFAWHAYLKDSRERLPRGYYIGSTFGGKQGQEAGYGGPPDAPQPKARILNRYLGLPPVLGAYSAQPGRKPGELTPQPVSPAASVFRCPGDRGSFVSNPEYTDTAYATHWDYYGNSYRSNRYLIGPTPPQPAWNDPCSSLIEVLRNRFDQLSINLSAVANESRLILVGDFGFDDWQNPATNITKVLPVEFHARAYTRRDYSSHNPSGDTVPMVNPLARIKYNVAFMDGHVSFIDIRKGLYVVSEYTMIPFRDMQQAFAEDQQAGHYPN